MQTLNVRGYTVIVDDDININPTELNIRRNRHTFYCYITRTNTLLHRFILGLKKWQGLVDHINQNGLDNRRENLRITTYAQNKINSKRYETVKGIYLCRYSGLWYARIKDGEKRRTIGSYRTQDAAIAAYKTAQQALIQTHI